MNEQRIGGMVDTEKKSMENVTFNISQRHNPSDETEHEKCFAAHYCSN